MTTPDTNRASLAIIDIYPYEFLPKARCLLYSETMPLEEALSLGRKAMERLPDHMRRRAFIEDVTAPATVRLICEHCNKRKNPYSLGFLKLLLNVD